MEYDQISRDEEKLLDYLDEWVHSSKTLKKYQEMIGKERCNSLEKGQCGKK